MGGGAAMLVRGVKYQIRMTYAYPDSLERKRPARAYEPNSWWEDIPSPLPLNIVAGLIRGADVRVSPDWNEQWQGAAA